MYIAMRSLACATVKKGAAPRGSLNRASLINNQTNDFHHEDLLLKAQ